MDPAGNWTTRRSPDDRKKTQTAVVWSYFPFIRSGQIHLARHRERDKMTRRIKEEVGRQHQGMDRPGVRQVPEGSGEQGKMEKTGCKIICGAPTTLAVQGLMMMMINILENVSSYFHADVILRILFQLSYLVYRFLEVMQSLRVHLAVVVSCWAFRGNAVMN